MHAIQFLCNALMLKQKSPGAGGGIVDEQLSLGGRRKVLRAIQPGSRRRDGNGGTPYDIDGVEFIHEGERCSFDTIQRICDTGAPALDCLATIVRGADTSRHDLAPQCGGLLSISLGLSASLTSPTTTKC